MEINIGHLIGAAIAGGCLTPLVQFSIDKWKGTSAKFQKIHQRLTEHEEKDSNRFQKLDDRITEQGETLLAKVSKIGEDVAFIKGKLS